MEKKLKTMLIILLMILICIAGFGGIYFRNKVLLKNKIPDYKFTSGFEGKRLTTFILDDSTTEAIYDSEGNKVDSIPEGENEESYKKEEVPINSDEIKTINNYEKTRDIIVKRLKTLGMSAYDVRVDKENGNMSVELNENKKTDSTLADLFTVGKFEVIDTDDKTLLMDTNDIEKATIYYNNTESGISVYLTIKFTKEGTKKFEQVTRDYAEISKSESENEEETETESEESTETTEETQKTITINIDGNKFLSTSFKDVIKTGDLTVLVGSASTDTDTVTENITSAQYYATILNNGELPLKYKTQSTEYIQSIYSDNLYIYIVIGVLSVIAVISIIYLIIKYKLFGLIASIIYIATIALITIMIRLTGAEIGIHTMIAGIIILFIIDYINCTILKNINKKNRTDEIKVRINNSYKKVFNIIIAILIPAIILTYNSFLSLSNIGTTLFWGIIIALFMNIVFTKKILIMKIDKK